MATLYRDSDGTEVDVLVDGLAEERPRIVARHPSEYPYVDNELNLPYVVRISIPIDARGGAKEASDRLAWLREADGNLRLIEDDGTEHPSLMLGTWSRAESPGGIRLSVMLEERVIVYTETELATPIAPRPRSDVSAATSDGEDDGDQATEAAPDSVLVRTWDWLTGLAG